MDTTRKIVTTIKQAFKGLLNAQGKEIGCIYTITKIEDRVNVDFYEVNYFDTLDGKDAQTSPTKYGWMAGRFLKMSEAEDTVEALYLANKSRAENNYTHHDDN